MPSWHPTDDPLPFDTHCVAASWRCMSSYNQRISSKRQMLVIPLHRSARAACPCLQCTSPPSPRYFLVTFNLFHLIYTHNNHRSAPSPPTPSPLMLRNPISHQPQLTSIYLTPAGPHLTGRAALRQGPPAGTQAVCRQGAPATCRSGRPGRAAAQV